MTNTQSVLEEKEKVDSMIFQAVLDSLCGLIHKVARLGWSSSNFKECLVQLIIRYQTS